MPLIVRWPGHVPAGRLEEKAILGAVDFFPIFCRLAGVPQSAAERSDGEDLTQVLLGQFAPRARPLLWEYGRNAAFGYPQGRNRSPIVAIREGKWKLLINADGSDREIYDLDSDRNETRNVAEQNSETAKRLAELALQWRKSLP